MPFHDDLAFATIPELRHRLDAGEVTPLDLTEFALDRLERYGPTYRALRTLMPERARADAERATGRREPVAGIPYGIKDSFAARGAPTSYGMAALRDQVIDEDAAPVAALARAGAVPVAKLTLPEIVTFREDERPEHAIDGAARNPWNLERWTGGSSSGSAAAIAAGLVPFALGSDSGGSISMPSAYCGITGLRPSLGVVPSTGSASGTPTLARSGPMARSAEDCRLIFEVIADHGVLEPAEPLDEGALRRVRVAFHEGDIEESAEPHLRSALRAGIEALRHLGVALRNLTLPVDLEIRRSLRSIAIAECAHFFEPFGRPGLLDFETDPDERAGYERSRALPAVEYLWALDERRRVMTAFDALFMDVDVIVSFTAPVTAPPLDQSFVPIPPTGGNTALLYGSILAALPSLTVPVGLADDGLPVGLQLVAARNRDLFLLRVGEALQATTDWHRLRPPKPPEPPHL